MKKTLTPSPLFVVFIKSFLSNSSQQAIGWVGNRRQTQQREVTAAKEGGYQKDKQRLWLCNINTWKWVTAILSWKGTCQWHCSAKSYVWKEEKGKCYGQIQWRGNDNYYSCNRGFIKVWSRSAFGFGTRAKFMLSLKNIKNFYSCRDAKSSWAKPS